MARPTIKDIAKHAGVSFKTVSRVLNGYASVADDLRERVQKSMHELDYRPNQAARQMRGKKAYNIALFPAFRDQVSELQTSRRMPTYVADVITGLIQACQAAHFHLFVEPAPAVEGPTGRQNFCSLLDNLRVDGVILIPPICDDEWIIEQLIARDILVGRLNPGTMLDRGFCTVIDNRTAAREVVDLLVAKGHSHIAYIKGPESHRAVGDRLGGVLDGAAAHNLRIDLRQGDFLFDSGRSATLDLLRLATPPTAIFAANDEMAAGALAAALELGVKVPDALSIVGFGGLLVSEATWPRLTTVSQPTIEMARSLGSQLIMAAGSPAAQAASLTVQPHRLVERQSVSSI